MPKDYQISHLFWLTPDTLLLEVKAWERDKAKKHLKTIKAIKMEILNVKQLRNQNKNIIYWYT